VLPVDLCANNEVPGNYPPLPVLWARHLTATLPSDPEAPFWEAAVGLTTGRSPGSTLSAAAG
jgi:hypothetical protein